MKSPRDNLVSGLKSIGLDGGLNLKTDPIQLAPPQTTTADNVWHITPGQARSLPSTGSAMLPSNNNLSNIVSTASLPPYLGNGVVAVQENGYPQVVNCNNPSIPLSSTPCYQSTFRTRIMAQSTSYYGAYYAYDITYTTPDAPINGKSPFATVQPGLAGTSYTFAISTGDLSSNACTATNEVSIATLTGSTSPSLLQYSTTWIPGDNQRFLIVWSDTGNSNAIRVGVFSYALNTPPVIYNITTPLQAFDVFIENQKVWLAYGTSTTGGNLRYAQLGTSGVITTLDATAHTLPSGVTTIAADYSNGAGFAVAFATPQAVQMYSTNPTSWTTGAFLVDLPTPTPLYSDTSRTATLLPGTLSVKVTKSDTGANQYCGAVFFNTLEYFTSGPAATYGVGSYFPYTYQTVCVRINGGTSGLYAATVSAPSFFRTPTGNQICGAAFSPNYYGPGGRGGPANNQDFMIPVILGAPGPYEHVANAAGGVVISASKYFLINSYGQVCGRWGDDAGGQFLPPVSAINRKAAVILNPSDNSAVDFCMPFHLNTGQTSRAADPTYTVSSSTVTYLAGGTVYWSATLGALAVWTYQAQNNACPIVHSGRNVVFGGNVTMLYDGQTLHEAGFHIPAHQVVIGDVTPVSTSGISITTTSGQTSATVSSTTGLRVGQTITGTGIPAYTKIIDIPSLTSITMSQAATASGSVSLGTMCQYQYVAVYEWVDAQGLTHRSAPSTPTQLEMYSSATNFGTVKLAVSVPDATYKYISPTNPRVRIRLYRTADKGTQFYLVASASMSATPPTSPTGNLSDFYVTFTDTTADQVLTNPPPGFAIVLNRLYTSADGSYSAQPPPPFVHQVASGGRLYGLACVNSFWRIYFSQQWDESSPPEFNFFCYLPVPAELGDCRSLGAYQNNIVVFASRGIATFSGAGPSRQLPLTKDGLVANGAALASIYNGNFTLVTPLPTPAGVRGTGSPVTIPSGIVYQDRAGFMLMDGSLNLTPVGQHVEPLTGTLNGIYPAITYGAGTLCEALSAAVWANPQGAPLVFDYTTGKWSTWSSQAYATRFVQAQDKSLYVAKQRMVAAASVSTNNPNVYPLTQFGGSMVVETPWLTPAPNEPTLGGTSPYASNVGEGNVWESELFGQYLGAHTLQVETALNYGAYQTGPGYVTQWAFSNPPAQYQFRLRPTRTNRIWAIRYRITVTPVGGSQEGARLGGIVVYSGLDTSVTRLGRSASV